MVLPMLGLHIGRGHKTKEPPLVLPSWLVPRLRECQMVTLARLVKLALYLCLSWLHMLSSLVQLVFACVVSFGFSVTIALLLPTSELGVRMLAFSLAM